MKKSIIITFIFALFSVMNSNAQEKQADKFTVKINGMGCPYCASGIENEFSKLKDISDIKIDISTGVLTFAYPPEADLSLEKVTDLVKKAGYTPVSANVVRANGKTENFEKSEKVGAVSETIKTETFMVAGNCEMCKTRIDKAANAVAGVINASWDVESKQLTVELDEKKTSLKEVHQAIAAVGHDSEGFKAATKTYNNLHTCCQYERL